MLPADPTDEDVVHALRELSPVLAVISALFDLCEIPLVTRVIQVMRTSASRPLRQGGRLFDYSDWVHRNFNSACHSVDHGALVRSQKRTATAVALNGRV